MKRRNFLQNAIYSGLAFPLAASGADSFAQAKGNIRVGFSSTDLKACIKSDTPYRYPLEAKCMVMEQERQSIILFALDFGEVYHGFCTDVQTQLGRRLNVNADSIMLHTTHTHSGPWDHGKGEAETMINRPALVDLLVKGTTQAFANAQPAKLKVAEENVGKRLSVYRRGDTKTGMGVQTYWFGYEYADGSDLPEASALINEMSSRWLGKYGNYKTGENKVYFDGPVDELVQAMYFVDMKGKPLGSIVRFAAHPHLASIFRKNLFDPDFCGRTRMLMEKELGGHCLFLQGGGGNLVPKEKVKYKLWDNYKFDNVYLGPISELQAIDENELLAETKRIGEDIARAALRALQREKFTDVAQFSYLFKPMNMPIDASLPKTAEEIEVIRKGLTSEYNSYLLTNPKLDELRRLANVINWLDWGPYYALGLLDEVDRKQGYKTMPYSVLRINETPVVFMNSEVSVETTLALRKKFPTQNPWTVSLTGGTISYIPTDKMMEDGGYEGRNRVIAHGTEPKIIEHIAGMLA